MNLVFNASAGTGKTYQVAQLYEKLVLDEGIDPCDILLMTFTDNAAAELRMRVAHRLLKRRHTAEIEDNDELNERASTATANLSWAPIGTIHSYCTHLLREHALEAGLSPNFSVLVGDERDEVLNQICRTELLTHLETDADFKAFCSGAYIIGTGRGFGASIIETVLNLIGQAGSLGVSLENTESLLPDPLPLVSIDEFRKIHLRLMQLPYRSTKVEDAMVVLGNCIGDAERATDVADLFDQRFSGHFSFGGARSIYPDFKALKEETRQRQQYHESHPAAKAFARYVQDVAHHFQQRKHEMDAVDFDDQLRLAKKLLESGKAKPDFRYVIVDEVQDTSRIQYDIIQSLWRGNTSLVICGDKKQSIYTWRGADPEVMPDLETAILAAGGDMKHLKTSFRSKEPILDVVNSLFTTVYGSETYSEHDHLQPNPSFQTEGEKRCVEFLSPNVDEVQSKKQKVADEMEAVANRIRLLVEGPSEWQPTYRHTDKVFVPTGDSNAYCYSDILILLRRTTHQAALEQALRHAHIPYTLGGKGRGLFTRQETRDVALFLNTLTNPRDSYSLIGFLRSPWIGLSDETIAELSWSENGFSIDQLMHHYAEKTDVIDRYRELLGRKLASELVRMLIDETGYDALLAGLPRGKQRLANLRKVIDWLRETERGVHTTPATVARKLSDRIDNPPDIPEAALLDPAQDAVTIMTVHSAKGLTKRVVFVPDMSFSANAENSFAQIFFDPHKQPVIGLRITAPDKSCVKSPGFDVAGDHASLVRSHESANLFYVAMTRARDLVVASASIGQRPAGWYKFLEPFIGSHIPAIPYVDLANAPKTTQPKNHTLPTVEQLAMSIGALHTTPLQPILQRIPATRLAREQDELEMDHGEWEEPVLRPTSTSSAVGSLGHAVLEQLALNHWEGSVSEWLAILRDDFAVGKAEAAALKKRIEDTRELMIQLTSGTQEIHPEYPFVLHKDNHLIDGTIDLLCRTDNGFAIFDYKFTDTDMSEVVNKYRNQMEIYSLAAKKRFPSACETSVKLIVVSTIGTRVVPVVF